MTRSRAIDSNHDFLFGKGQNDYVTANLAVAQNINTRLSSFLGNCFFDLGAGLDWITILSSKNQLAANLAISAIILNTTNVTGILQLNINLNAQRNLTVSYKVATTYSSVTGQFQYDLNGIG